VLRASLGQTRPFLHLLAAVLLLLPLHTASAGEVRTGLQAHSAALSGPLRYSIYLPDAYQGGAERFPVIYLLHGYGANHREWLERGRLAEILDGLIGSEKIPPLVAVMPDAGKSWYVDSAKTGGPGDYETAIVRDLVGHIDTRYRTNRTRSHRLVAGLSMGGYGALRLAFAHPDRFGAVASFSGALFEGVGIPGVDGAIEQSPQAAERWYVGAFGRPFDPDRYRALSPFSKVQALARHRTPPRILITSGDDDYFKFYEGSAALFAALGRAGVPAELRIDDGGHDWQLWRKQFARAIRFLTAPLRHASRESDR